MQKSHPKVVNPRDIAGERKKKNKQKKTWNPAKQLRVKTEATDQTWKNTVDSIIFLTICLVLLFRSRQRKPIQRLFNSILQSLFLLREMLIPASLVREALTKTQIQGD